MEAKGAKGSKSKPKYTKNLKRLLTHADIDLKKTTSSKDVVNPILLRSHRQKVPENEDIEDTDIEPDLQDIERNILYFVYLDEGAKMVDPMHLQAKWCMKEFAVLQELIINSEPSVNGNETDLLSHRSNTVHKLDKMKGVEWLAVIICFIFAYDKPTISLRS
jgi:hypothetical protein